MVLTKTFMVHRERVNEVRRNLERSPWPGDERVPPNQNIRCRKTEVVKTVGDFQLIAVIFEG